MALYDRIALACLLAEALQVGRHGVASAVSGNRFYAVSGDVQSSGTGVAVSTSSVDAFEFTKQ
jgi:hypothetical protein